MEDLEQVPDTSFERDVVYEEEEAFCLSKENIKALKLLLAQVTGCLGGALHTIWLVPPPTQQALLVFMSLLQVLSVNLVPVYRSLGRLERRLSKLPATRVSFSHHTTGSGTIMLVSLGDAKGL